MFISPKIGHIKVVRYPNLPSNYDHYGKGGKRGIDMV